MGNYLNPDHYRINRGEKELNVNWTVTKVQNVFDPFIRNPYVGIIIIPVGFIFPVITIIGLVGTIFVILIMANRKVKITKSARFFYLTIGISDLIHNIFFGTLMGILMDALYMWTNKKFWISTYPEDGGAVWCKLAGFFWYLSENYSNYTLMAFSIERLIATYFPIKSRRILSMRFSIILTLICFIPAWLSMLPDNILLFTTVEDLGWSYTEYSCIEDYSHPFYLINGIIFLVVLCGIHAPVTTLCIFAILIKIRGAAKIRKLHLTRVSNKETSLPSVSEISTTLSLFFIGGMNVLIFFFLGITWIGYVLVLRHLLRKEDLIGLFGIGNRIGSSLLTGVHTINFFVYFAIIPSFRKQFFACISSNKRVLPRPQGMKNKKEG